MAFFISLLLPELSDYYLNISIEYGSTGILCVILFYIYGESPIHLIIGYFLLSDLDAYYTAVRRLQYTANQSFLESLTSFKQIWRIHVDIYHSLQTFSGIFFQSRSIIAVPIIWLCNWGDQQGFCQIRLNKYIGYWFYPVHMTILMIILYVQQLY